MSILVNNLEIANTKIVDRLIDKANDIIYVNMSIIVLVEKYTLEVFYNYSYR